MKELIGRQAVIGIEGGDKIKGEIIADFTDRIVIGAQSEKDKNKTNVVNVLKAKMTYFALEESIGLEELKKSGSAASAVPLTILGCHNKEISCNGVRFVAGKRENQIEKEDFEKFMAPCPVRRENCKCGVVGNFINAKPEVLIDIFGELVVGEYPTEETVKQKKGVINGK